MIWLYLVILLNRVLLNGVLGSADFDDDMAPEELFRQNYDVAKDKYLHRKQYLYNTEKEFKEAEAAYRAAVSIDLDQERHVKPSFNLKSENNHHHSEPDHDDSKSDGVTFSVQNLIIMGIGVLILVVLLFMMMQMNKKRQKRQFGPMNYGYVQPVAPKPQPMPSQNIYENIALNEDSNEGMFHFGGQTNVVCIQQGICISLLFIVGIIVFVSFTQ
jgi:flagellar biosynthesis/type III secretory pathway M-ring protein FliF/YscJ